MVCGQYAIPVLLSLFGTEIMVFKETYYVQVFYFILKEDYFDIFSPRLNSVTIYANHNIWFLFISSNAGKFEEGKMKKPYLN